ncbi:MAG: alpha/beta fold hydrolase [Rhizobiaceae bacterium]
MTTSRLFAREKGGGDKVVVFLHGFVDTHVAWHDIQDAIALEASTLAFDLPGYGKSVDYPDPARPKAVVEALLQELNQRQLGPVHLVGHSRGGAIAVLVALAAPDLVTSMTLLAPGGFGTEINHRLLSRYAEAVTATELKSIMENMYGWNNPVTDDTVRHMVEMRQVEGQREKLIEIAKHLHRDGKQGVIPREQLASLYMPVKILWGTQDRVLPTRQAHRLPPMFAAHIFEDTGHMLPAEIPDDVVALIKQNLR